jgi:hypothetical protein
MSRQFPALVKLFAIALSASALFSCAGIAKKVSDNTLIKFEDIHVDDPARQGLTVVKELLGAALGSAPSSRDEGLSMTLRLYLENKNGFTLELSSVTYTFYVEGRIAATGRKDGKKGELAFEPGRGRVVELPVRVFTRDMIGHVLGGVVKKGAKLVISGTFTFNTALGEVAFPYSSEKTI